MILGICIDSGVKLVPKYLHKLANAFLVYDNYEETLNNICKHEGALSENGDKWVHKESGYTLKSIEFTDNFGVDNDGNMIQQNEVLPEDYDETDILEENGDDYDEALFSIGIYDNPTIKFEKKIVLSEFQKELLNLMFSLSEIFGIKIRTEESKEKLVKEIYNICLSYSRTSRDKSKFPIFVTQVYSTMCFLLCYVQMNNIKVKKTFPNCKSSFAGFPLEDEENVDGIIYLSCVLKQLSKAYPYDAFKSKTQEEIANELLVFMKTHVLRNAYIVSQLNEAKDKIQHRIALGLTEPEYFGETIHIFRPSLKEVNVDEPFQYKSSHETGFEKFAHIEDSLGYLNKRLEDKFSKLIAGHLPLFTTKYEQPYLVNHCCYNSDYLIQYMVQGNEKEKEELKKLMNSIRKYEIENHVTYQDNIRNHSLCVVKQNPPSPLNMGKSLDYDDSTIYMFFIYNCNFDYELPVPEYFASMGIEKPSSVYYNRNFDLMKKIQVLKDNGYNFTQDQMIDALKNISIMSKKSSKESEEREEEEEKDAKSIPKFKSSLAKEFEEELQIHEERPDRFFHEKLMKQFDNFNRYIVTSSIVSNDNPFKSFYQYIDEYQSLNNDELQNLTQFIRNINYYLTSIYPGYVKYDKVNINIICKHWDLAGPHYKDIQQKYEDYIGTLHKIELESLGSDEIMDLKHVLNNIESLSSFVDNQNYKSNALMNYLYQKYLCSFILEQYTSEESNKAYVKKMNKSILDFMKYMLKKNRYSYESIKKRMYQTKQSEKQIKTDYLKNMKKAQRKVEEIKMQHKLGVWALGLKNSIYKYDKDHYVKNSNEAEQVQEIVNSIYDYDNTPLSVYSEDGGVAQEQQEQYNEIDGEEPSMALMAEDDDFGEELDGDEYYN